MADQVLTDRNSSPWTRRDNVRRVLWYLVRRTLFRYSFRTWFRWRAAWLRLFGARLASNVYVRRTASIEMPWNLVAGEYTSIGDHAVIYSLGTITLGRYVTISQYAHLCAGTHDTRDRRMRLLCPPITIGDDAWIAADAFVGPGVTIGARTILGARSSAFSDLPPDVVAVGLPAKPIKARVFTAE
ncbi:MAG TPA: hypothetical protein VF595_06060 [Tepidisphaeraceae bacterium]|jgi:putative colanic acid biosynthesis acetyltransferase WcaF